MAKITPSGVSGAPGAPPSTSMPVPTPSSPTSTTRLSVSAALTALRSRGRSNDSPTPPPRPLWAAPMRNTGEVGSAVTAKIKIGAQQNLQGIGPLPKEIIDLIFDYLFENAKTTPEAGQYLRAMELTCKRWQSMANKALDRADASISFGLSRAALEQKHPVSTEVAVRKFPHIDVPSSANRESSIFRPSNIKRLQKFLNGFLTLTHAQLSGTKSITLEIPEVLLFHKKNIVSKRQPDASLVKNIVSRLDENGAVNLKITLKLELGKKPDDFHPMLKDLICTSRVKSLQLQASRSFPQHLPVNAPWQSVIAGAIEDPSNALEELTLSFDGHSSPAGTTKILQAAVSENSKLELLDLRDDYGSVPVDVVCTLLNQPGNKLKNLGVSIGGLDASGCATLGEALKGQHARSLKILKINLYCFHSNLVGPELGRALFSDSNSLEELCIANNGILMSQNEELTDALAEGLPTSNLRTLMINPPTPRLVAAAIASPSLKLLRFGRHSIYILEIQKMLDRARRERPDLEIQSEMPSGDEEPFDVDED